jgi:hypothetical protein
VLVLPQSGGLLHIYIEKIDSIFFGSVSSSRGSMASSRSDRKCLHKAALVLRVRFT